MKKEKLENYQKQKFNRISIRNLINSFYDWISCGSKPPAHFKKSLFISFFLLLTGLCLFTFTLLSYFQIYFTRRINSYPFAFTISLIALIPGVYSSIHIFCCWRRIPGFDWEMISVYWIIFLSIKLRYIYSWI